MRLPTRGSPFTRRKVATVRWLFQQTRARRVAVFAAILAAVDVLAFAFTGSLDAAGTIYLGVVLIATIEVAMTLASRTSHGDDGQLGSRAPVERIAGKIAEALELAGPPDRAEWLRGRAELFGIGSDTQREEVRVELQRVCTEGMGGLHDVYYGTANPRVSELIDDLFAGTKDWPGKPENRPSERPASFRRDELGPRRACRSGVSTPD